jgi:hypothetical protein
MRIMVIVKGPPEEANWKPDTKQLSQMLQYNEMLAKEGVLVAAEGLKAPSTTKRVRFDDDKQAVIDGPHPEAKEVIGGFWMLQVKSMDEGLEYVKRIPFGGGAEVEVRPVSDLDDFGAAMTPKLREKEQRLAQQIAKNAAQV